MLRRLFIVLASPWAVLFLWNGSTRAPGILPGDVALALGPFAIGWVLARAGRYVLTGSFRRPVQRVYTR